jgi:hypothetical protein
MICKREITFVRGQCRNIYTLGEHSTACLYAVCEFTDLHILLIAASAILIIGIILILIDQMLTALGL